MYVLVETKDAKTHNFLTLDDLDTWVKEQKGGGLSGNETLHPDTTATLTKVKEYIDRLLSNSKKTECTNPLPPKDSDKEIVTDPLTGEFKGNFPVLAQITSDIDLFSGVQKKKHETFNLDQSLTNQYFGINGAEYAKFFGGEKHEYSESWFSADFKTFNSEFGIEQFNNTPEEQKCLEDFINFFYTTFCTPYVERPLFCESLEDPIHLALLNIDFCVSSPYMSSTPGLVVPTEINFLCKMFKKKYAQTEFVKIAKYLADKIPNDTYYVLREDSFILYKLLKQSMRHLTQHDITFELVRCFQNDNPKNALSEIVKSFLETLSRNENSSIQSAEVFFLWKEYIHSVFQHVQIKEITDTINSLATQKFLAKELKKNNIFAQRKSAGIFYLGIGLPEKNISKQTCEPEYCTLFQSIKGCGPSQSP